MKRDIIILGAGLSGLTLAYFLKKKGISALLLEASDRAGGRIRTLKGETGVTVEMGATWFGMKHEYLVALLKELAIGYFPQYTKGVSLFETMSFIPAQHFQVPESEEPSYRIENGSESLIQKLVEEIDESQIVYNTKVSRITADKEQIILQTNNHKAFTASRVISTIPPNLLVKTISFQPELPQNLLQLCKKTHTWMSESIKFAVEYNESFWRKEDFSGTVFSQSGIIQEQYDHSDKTGTKTFALKGFLNNGTNKLSRQEREAKVKSQLIHLFGEAAGNYNSYHEKVWSDDEFTHIPYDSFVMPHQNNGHSLFQESFHHNRFYISGTETSPEFPGYMDGAVYAAKLMAEKITK